MLHNHNLNSSRFPPVSQTSHTYSPDSTGQETTNAPSTVSQGREAVSTRGRAPPSSYQPSGATPPSLSRAQSAQPPLPEPGYSRSGPNAEAGLQRKSSNNYGHHRQTSVIHGVQHSRNTSFNSVSTASPLSPESLASAANSLKNATVGRRGNALTTELPSNYSSPGSEPRSHGLGHSVDSTIEAAKASEEVINGFGHARKHTHPSRPRRNGAHHTTHSQTQPEARTAGEYALHHLFNSFVVHADQKINQCITNLDDMVTPVEQVCGATVDEAFDQLVAALGHIARQEPKPLVDSVMLWRKAKGDAASLAKKQLHQQRLLPPGSSLPNGLPRRNTEPVNVNGHGVGSGLPTHPHPQPVESTPAVRSTADEYTLADRRATVSVFLLCRVLIAVFEQSTLAALTGELAEKLENIVFQQLRDVDPVQIMNSSLRLANWRIYGQLLGQMSNVDFVNVTNNFVAELDSCQQDIARSPGSISAKESENRVELLILGMRHLRIKRTRAGWPSSCEFLRSIGSLFVGSHGPRIKQAYCQVLEKLLLPVAAEPDSSLNEPIWRDFIDMMNSRLGQMLTKVRHWNSGFPLSILLLCVSPTETFASQWLATIHNLAPKLKDRSTRSLVLQAICRLTWTYLHRVAEPPAARIQKLDEVIKIAIPQGKKTHLSTEPYVMEPLIQLIRIIGFRNQDLCFRKVVFPLINSDLFQSNKELRIEQMEPEKMVIGIRAFLTIMADLEKGDHGRPPFPLLFPTPTPVEPLPTSPIPSKSKLLAELHPSAATREDVSARPVNVASLSEVAKLYYVRFCEILGKITILCDNTFGGQATLNEKFSGSVPKTPLVDAFTFSRREDGGIADHKQSYYDLLHVAIQALPRCFSDHVPLASLINLLCTGSAHVQPHIAASSAQSLRSIARQGHAQAVAVAFPRFIFSYDSKYSTMSDDGMLGSGHIEATLTLYVELLQIWTGALRLRAKGVPPEALDHSASSSTRAGALEMTNVYPHVDEIEAYGLFFLCSQSRRVRSFAIKVLRLVTDFDRVLGNNEPCRIIRILEDEFPRILELNDDSLNVAERSRLHKDRQKSATQNTLIEICSSEVSYDSTLWFKVFPNLIRIAFELCPNAIALSRGFITDRLLLLHKSIEDLSVMSRTTIQDFRVAGRSAATPPEVLIDQWKLYLIMACVTLSSAGAQSQSQLDKAAHTRKTSKPNSTTSEQLSSARSLFSAIIPLLSAGPDTIRSAVVIALGSINHKLYRTLLESLQYAVIKCNDEAKARIAAHQRTPSSPQWTQQTEKLRTEVTHVYKLTATFLRDSEVCNDEWVLNNLVNYARDLRIFLSDAEIQHEWEFQRLRYHYCGLMEEVFEGINRTRNPARWLPFESRKSSFTLMEDWCGYSSDQNHIIRSREDALKQSLITQHAESGERVNVNAAMEKEKSSLRLAALSAMASLCAGPVSIRTESGTILSFQISRMLSWVESMFATATDKTHVIGRRALKMLIIHNKEQPLIMEHAIEKCYRTDRPKALESYFDVVTEVLLLHPDYPLPYWRILGAVIFTLGNENREIRMKSAHLLRTLDERQQKRSKLQDFDISISDKTTAVYKLAQFEYSKRLSKAYPEFAFTIFSEFSLHFKNVNTDHQRNMVAAILPWIQTLELQLDPTGGPTAVSYMLLSNMFEITIRSSSVLHNEVQALWQALATGPHAGNVQLILDFIIFLSLERREQNFVEYAKQIVVYLSATPAGSRVIEFFLLQLVPKNMVNEKKASQRAEPDVGNLPYVADLAAILPMGNKQAGLSLGQVALIFLVDLMVTPVTLARDNAIKLVHVVLILWDHYIPSVQDQAREMLVHLIHELVTSKIKDDLLMPKKHQIEHLVEDIRKNETRVTWSYEDSNGKDYEDTGNRVPTTMAGVAKEVVDLFSTSYDNFSDLWAKEALQWASTCPVRHLACRSFQIFRCISVALDSRMLADMLARLSNTIADEQTDYQTFSLEILTTLKVIIGALDPPDLMRYPQLFWTTCACLNTIHEREFFEALGMLEKLLERIDLSDASVITALFHARPAKWEGGFEGLQPLVYKGLKSADCLDRTLLSLRQLADLPDSELVGDESRLLYGVLANLPRLLRQYDLEAFDIPSVACADRLAQVAQTKGYFAISGSLSTFAKRGFSNGPAFLKAIIAAIRETFFPQFDSQSLVFIMGFLTNKTTWFRLKTMEILCVLIPEIDMKKAETACHGPDLISPLLRLLQTDLCPQALEVMDHIMEVSGNPMERHHIRMSMASGPARAIRKEYERTQSLYGIPMSSGWSIPMPAVFSSLTRNNVHAVFYTCGDPDVVPEETVKTPEFEISGDDGYTDSYFSRQRTATMKSIDTVTDANMGDLVHKLDSLDDFFDEPESASTPTLASHGGFPSDLHEHGTSIYDLQTAPILQKSLARTSSSLSFQNGLAESRPPTSHHHTQPSMNPGAFALNTMLPTEDLGGPGPSLPNSTKKPIGAPLSATRPGLHTRSITSPANNVPLSQPVPLIPTLSNASSFSSEDNNALYEDGMASDSENSPFPSLTLTTSHPIKSLSGPGPTTATSTPGSAFYRNTPTSATEITAGGFSFEGMRRGMRRLTGGKTDSQKEKDRVREMARMRALSGGQGQTYGVVGPPPLSPRVPKVPLEYLTASANIVAPPTSATSP